MESYIFWTELMTNEIIEEEIPVQIHFTYYPEEKQSWNDYGGTPYCPQYIIIDGAIDQEGNEISEFIIEKEKDFLLERAWNHLSWGDFN